MKNSLRALAAALGTAALLTAPAAPALADTGSNSGPVMEADVTAQMVGGPGQLTPGKIDFTDRFSANGGFSY
ncbi:hypothetical protein AB0O91_39745 [Kitasatospora sp. NPDC089797]|uniref:hypothetical protein n=1 Tax=Kitasatospora sp. NPDC089797 TaxID=3155298 RepID=UPI003445879B